MLANKCGIDPFDFREMNLLEWKPFTTDPKGVFPSGYAPEVFPLPEMMKKARPYYEMKKRRRRAMTSLSLVLEYQSASTTRTTTERTKLQAMLN